MTGTLCLGSSACSSSLQSVPSNKPGLNRHLAALQNKTNKDPPQIQETLTKRSKELTSLPVCFFSFKLFLNSSHAQRLLDTSEGYSHLWVPTFLSTTPGAQPQAGVRIFPHTPPGPLCISCECLQLSVASTQLHSHLSSPA